VNVPGIGGEDSLQCCLQDAPRDMKKAVFLDRDGVINLRLPGDQYVVRWEDFKFLPGVAKAIRSLNLAGWLVIVVTNQSAVAKKLLTESELRQIHQNMVEGLSREGTTIDAIYCCLHDSKDNCECRKPKPGMILQAARDHEIQLSASWMVGDDLRDIQAGKAAGCKTILLKSGSPILTTLFQPDFAADSLAGATALISEDVKSFNSGHRK